MAGSYAEAATQAKLIPDLQAAMNEIDANAQGERAIEGPLRTSSEMWKKSQDAIDGVIASFPTVANNLLSVWQSRAESGTFRTATNATTQSLIASHNSIGGSSNPRDGAGGVPMVLVSLADMIAHTASQSGSAKSALDAAAAAFNEAWNAMPAPMGASAATGLAAARTADEKLFVDKWRPHVVMVGQQLNLLASMYQQYGQRVLAAGQELTWAGPGAGSSSPATVGPRATDGPGMSTGGPAEMLGGPTGGPSSSDAAAGPAGAEGGGPAGGAGDPAAAGGDPAGGTGGPGTTGGMPTGPGGTGLAGTDTLPKPPTLPPGALPPGSLPPGSLPPGSLPPGGIPVGGIPRPPVTSGSGLTASKGLSAADKMKLPAATGLGGGLGGGGLGGLKGGEPGADLPAGGDRAIPRAGEQVTGPQQQGSGRPPAAPAGIGSGSSAAPATGSGVPPMMPPGGAMAGAGGGTGRGGKAGTGALRPTARGRSRQAGETPGVPAGLRGRSSGTAFPTVPATMRRRPEGDPQAETLQLLDEELWQIEEPEPVAPKRQRRLAT